MVEPWEFKRKLKCSEMYPSASFLDTSTTVKENFILQLHF